MFAHLRSDLASCPGRVGQEFPVSTRELSRVSKQVFRHFLLLWVNKGEGDVMAWGIFYGFVVRKRQSLWSLTQLRSLRVVDAPAVRAVLAHCHSVVVVDCCRLVVAVALCYACLALFAVACYCLVVVTFVYWHLMFFC